MGGTHPWWLLSGFAFAVGILWLGLSGALGWLLLRRVWPLLSETRNQIQDLGDHAAHTVNRASEAMALIELRVSEAMGEAAQAGKAASKQAVGVGSLIAGIYIVSRVSALLARRRVRPADRRNRRRR